jgi:hypothetical protein
MTASKPEPFARLAKEIDQRGERCDPEGQYWISPKALGEVLAPYIERAARRIAGREIENSQRGVDKVLEILNDEIGGKP